MGRGVEFEVSWTKKPDFLLALGVQDSGPSIKGAFRFEVWGNDLVAHRESEREADVAPIRGVGDGPGLPAAPRKGIPARGVRLRAVRGGIVRNHGRGEESGRAE